MRAIYIILMVLVGLSAQAQAEPRLWGIDQLGGSKYKEEIIQSHPDGFALGIFTQAEIFGDAYPVVDEALAKRKIPLVRYNLRWSDTHSFKPKDFQAIVAEAKRFLPLVKKYPAVECQFSGATEHQLNDKNAAELARQVLAVIPERCKYVNNPWLGKGALLPTTDRIINEVHGSDAQKPPMGGPYNFSFDGSDAFDEDVSALKDRFNDADVFFFWTSQNNGLADAKDKTPRDQRKFWPSGDLMRAMAFFKAPEGQVSLPENFVLEPKSRQRIVPPTPPDLMPLLVIPPKVDRVQLVTDDGKVIAESGSAEALPDGRFRYYLSHYGYKIAEKATQMHGKPTASLRVGTDVVGVVNPGYRVGSE